MSAPAWGTDPWYVVDHGHERLYVRDKGGLIAQHSAPWKYEGQDERYAAELARYKARAHLIAAAPELAEALEELVRMEDQDFAGVVVRASEYLEAIDNARAALRKARGEG